MKLHISLTQFALNEPTNYQELLGLQEVQNQITEDILELQLSGTYIPFHKMKVLQLELEAVKNRLVVFYN